MIFPLFIATTLLEIYVFASVGSMIGGFSTVLLVIITAFIGSFLLKQQGWATMAKAQNAITNGKIPTVEILEGVVILISGVLLLTPGFITDTVGLLGLIPFSRRYFINKILTKNAKKIFTQKKSIFIRTSSNENKKSNKNNTIEGEFWED